MMRVIVLLIFGAILVAGGCRSHGQTLNDFVLAEIKTESNGNTNSIGDNGAAIGCLQIHKVCWQDATEFDSSIGGKYSNCFNQDYSIKIFLAYMKRYCPQAIKSNDFETMARTWNGGGGGIHNPRTILYWHKVRLAMHKK